MPLMRREFLATALAAMLGRGRPTCVACGGTQHIHPVIDYKDVRVAWMCGLCVMAVLPQGHWHQIAVQQAVDAGTCGRLPVSFLLLPDYTLRGQIGQGVVR